MLNMIAHRVATRYLSKRASSSETVDEVARILMESEGIDPDSENEFDEPQQALAHDAARELLAKVKYAVSNVRVRSWIYRIPDFASQESEEDAFDFPMRQRGWSARQYVKVEYPSAFTAEGGEFTVDLSSMLPQRTWLGMVSAYWMERLQKVVDDFVVAEADVDSKKNLWDGRLNDEDLETALYNGEGNSNLALSVKTKYTVESPDGPVEPREGLDAYLIFKGKNPRVSLVKSTKQAGTYWFKAVVGFEVEIEPPEV